MNTIIMNQDVHTPAFIKADASNKSDKDKQQPTSPKQVRRFGWTRFLELAILLSIVIGAIWLISKIVMPQVVTVVSVIAGFLILRFIVRVILTVAKRRMLMRIEKLKTAILPKVASERMGGGMKYYKLYYEEEK